MQNLYKTHLELLGVHIYTFYYMTGPLRGNRFVSSAILNTQSARALCVFKMAEETKRFPLSGPVM